MNARCKPGDLAIVVRANHPENIGKILQVVEVDKIATVIFDELVWKVHGWYVGCLDDPNCRFACDSQLKPLRDSDELDETLMWAPLPTEPVTT